MKIDLMRHALPGEDGIQFPINGEIQRDYELHSAWYSGEEEDLERVYAGKPNSFWGKIKDEGMPKLHVPTASDLSQTSADLLFSNPPTFTVDDEKTQERLDQIVEDSGIINKLLEAGESASALGGVFLKPVWDAELADYPIMTIAQADIALPHFTLGILRALDLIRLVAVVDSNGEKEYWRHIERHEPGLILNGLYKGTKDKLGKRISLDAHPDTADLQDEIDTGYPGLMVEYVPNVRPNRKFRGSMLGQSDYAGVESLMDALDETYTSWIRDVRLARARMMVPESFLEYEKGENPIFDNERALYVMMTMDPLTSTGTSSPITATQFSIRTDEHRQTALELLDRIITHAGYSPQTFGLKIEGRAESGTALSVRERKSFSTRDKKWRYWKGPLERILERMLFIDYIHLGNREIKVVRPTAELNKNGDQDFMSMANSIQMLHGAQAISIDTKVRMLHPDWDEETILAEIEAIKQENGLSMANPDEIGMA